MLNRFPKLFPAVCLLLFSLFLPACSDSPPPATERNGTQNATEARSDTQRAAQEAESAEVQADDALSLALQSIDMSQGQGGLEVWHLKAEWANMVEEDGKIIVHQPRLTYFIPPPDKGEMHIVSDSGNIYQEEQVLEFIKNVVVSQEGSLLTSELLVYNGTAATMTFPDGGIFVGEGMDGQASIIRWHMNQRRIEAEGSVSVDFNKEETVKGE